MQNHRPHHSFIHSLKHSYICSVLFSSVRLSIIVRYAPLESCPATFSTAQLTDFELQLLLFVLLVLLVCLIFIKSLPCAIAAMLRAAHNPPAV